MIITFKTLFSIMLGGALGALARFGLNAGVMMLFNRGFPWGIFVANVLGSFLMGVLWVFFETHLQLTTWRAFAITGFLGALTTFSSFSLDTVQLLMAGRMSAALLNVLLNVVLCLLATGAGIWMMR